MTFSRLATGGLYKPKPRTISFSIQMHKIRETTTCPGGHQDICLLGGQDICPRGCQDIGPWGRRGVCQCERVFSPCGRCFVRVDVKVFVCVNGKVFVRVDVKVFVRAGVKVFVCVDV